MRGGQELLPSSSIRNARNLKFYTISNTHAYCFHRLHWIGVGAKITIDEEMLDNTEKQALITFFYLQGKSPQTMYEDMSVVYSNECPKMTLINDRKRIQMWSHNSIGWPKRRLFMKSHRTSCGGNYWGVSACIWTDTINLITRKEH